MERIALVILRPDFITNTDGREIFLIPREWLVAKQVRKMRDVNLWLVDGRKDGKEGRERKQSANSWIGMLYNNDEKWKEASTEFISFHFISFPISECISRPRFS